MTGHPLIDLAGFIPLAVVVAVAAARDVIAKQMTAAEGNALIDAAIAEVEAKLH